MTGPSPSVFTSVRHARRRRGASVLKWGGALLLVGLLSFAVGLTAVWGYGTNRLEAVPVGTPVIPAGNAAAGAPTTTLVSVVDGERSTDVLLVQTGAPREVPLVVSLPLDLQVQPEGQPEQPLAAVREQQAGDGGLAALAATVAGYAEIPVHHAVEVDPWRLVAAIGPDQPVTLPDPGTVTEDRFGRVELLLTGLRQLGAELSSTRVVLDPLRARGVLDAVAEHVRADVDPGPLGLRRLAARLAAPSDPAPDVRTVPAFHDPATGVTHPYWEQAQTLFQALRLGEPVPGGLGAADPHEDELVPARVRVEVLNAVGTAGLAGSVADRLTAAGFTVVGTGNTDPFDPAATTTRVLHGPGGEMYADLVVAVLGEGVVVERQDGLARDQVVVHAAADQVAP